MPVKWQRVGTMEKEHKRQYDEFIEYENALLCVEMNAIGRQWASVSYEGHIRKCRFHGDEFFSLLSRKARLFNQPFKLPEPDQTCFSYLKTISPHVLRAVRKAPTRIPA